MAELDLILIADLSNRLTGIGGVYHSDC